MVTLSVCPWTAWLGLSELMVGMPTTMKPFVKVLLPHGVVTETSLGPADAEPPMVMLAVIVSACITSTTLLYQLVRVPLAWLRRLPLQDR